MVSFMIIQFVFSIYIFNFVLLEVLTLIHVTHLKDECDVAGGRASDNNGRILNLVKLMGVLVK